MPMSRLADRGRAQPAGFPSASVPLGPHRIPSYGDVSRGAWALKYRSLERYTRAYYGLAPLASAQQQGWALVALTAGARGRGEREPARHLRALRAELDLAAHARGARPHAFPRRSPRPAANDVPLCDRADQDRASSRQEPGRDRQRTQRRPHPHHTGRPALVSPHHPPHPQANQLTPGPVAICGKCDARTPRVGGPHRRCRLTVLDMSRFGLPGAGSRYARDGVTRAGRSRARACGTSNTRQARVRPRALSPRSERKAPA
jgi:hypothetical protein